jgi:hypothetical protein
MEFYVYLEVNSHIDLLKMFSFCLKRLQHGENKCKVAPVLNSIPQNENV